MLIIRHNQKQHIDQLLRAYKRKVEETRLPSRIKDRMTHKKKSTRLRRQKMKAIYTQQYRLKNDLV